MKIGILTYHRAHNYGAVLQAYALKTYLTDLGHTVKFIDYWPISHEKIYRLWNTDLYRNKSCVIKMKLFISFLLLFFKKIKRINRFNAFIRSYLGVGKIIRHRLLAPDIDLDVDLLVYGSDQIWRNWITKQQYIGFDPTYFGYNVDSSIPKIAYAASMGIINYNDEELIFLKEAIHNFSTVLVRERLLSNLLKNFDCKADIVCDPVFLLSKHKWNSILPQERYLLDEYVVYYRLLPSVKAEKLAVDIAKRNNCKLLVITASVAFTRNRNEKQTLSPLEFIQMIRDAKVVIATSFHGTAFSLIFEKQFYTLGLGTNSDRVLTLLKNVALEDRYIQDFNSIKYNDIDYTETNNKIVNMLHESKRLLNKAINNL